MENQVVLAPETVKYTERIQRVNDAIALKETDKIPFAPLVDGVVQDFFDSSYKNIFYDYKKAGDAVIQFFSEYPIFDASSFVGFTSGRANELAGTQIIDWPGRPGTKVSDHSTQQVLEQPFMTPEEYPELLSDYTGFILRKFIPRVYSNLQGFSGFNFTMHAGMLSTGILAPLYSPAAQEAYKTIIEIGKYDTEARALLLEMSGRLKAIGMPPFLSGVALAPYDILGNFFRGTIGLMEDLFEYEDEIEAACKMFADQQIAALQYFRSVPMPVKRVFFPLHKGMDGFMSQRQYDKLYWKPLQKIMLALIDMGVTPYIYTEGKYHTRLEHLTDVPKGKVIYHFEDVDMKKAKSIFNGIACIVGNLPTALLDFGKKEEIVDYCKFLIDTCAPGSGYIFDTSSAVENAKRENFDAVVEVFETYR